jgi:hypothetical protein
MGFLSSLGSAISSACSSIGSAISSAVSVISPTLSLGIEIVKAVSLVAQTVLKVLEIISPDEKLEDMGDKVQQASEAGITLEKFEKFDEYVQAIRNFELDPEKSKKTTEVEKLAVGLGFASLALENKYKGSDVNNLANLWNLVAKNPDYFTSERILSMLPVTQDMKSIADYFGNKLDTKEALSVEKTLFDLDKSLSPNKSDDAIYKELDAAKDSYNSRIE